MTKAKKPSSRDKNLNRLANATSPYLQQHANNPVAWWQWSREALNCAKEKDKPILLSVGYSACHWCHVMAHESFEDSDTAEIMNSCFVNIKVDREERPDIDAIYQKALALMGEQGGWPLTMFLTPDLVPFFGGTYFPPVPRYGVADFKTVLNHIHRVFHENKNLVRHNVSAISDALATQFSAPPENKTTLPTPDALAKAIFSRMDTTNGGTIGAPKFPQVPLLKMLWHSAQKQSDSPLKNIVLLTMERMSLGGIHDHIAGGYARYSTDPIWFAPHFEKMLYDNALILEMLAHLYRTDPNPLWQRRSEQLVEWLLSEMTSSEKTFFSALDADSEGKEGQFYIWQKSEIEQALSEDASWYCQQFNISSDGNWHEGGVGANILYLEAPETRLNEAERTKLSQLSRLLYKRRAKRPRPGLDNKILADWNGMMITALAVAGKIFKKQDWCDRAVDAFHGILQTMENNEGALCHSRCHDINSAEVFLDDYAQMARAALALYQSTGRDDFLHHAEKWIALVKSEFARPEGGFYSTRATAEGLIIRPLAYEDYATPSGNGVMAEILQKIYIISGKEAYRDDLHALYDGLAPFIAQHPLSSPALIVAKDISENNILLSIIGNDEKAIEDFQRIAHQSTLPTLFTTIHKKADDAPAHIQALFSDGASKLKSTIAIVCQHERCSLPLFKVEELRKELNALKTRLQDAQQETL